MNIIRGEPMRTTSVINVWSILTIAICGALPGREAIAQQQYSVILRPGMSTREIQQKLQGSTGAVYFSPGVYWLTDSLPVQSGRTYIGAGSPDPRLGSILIQTATDSSGLGLPIFIVGANCPQNPPSTVTITGLTFDGVSAANARAIAAGSLDQFNKLIPASDSFGELQGWKIRG